MTPENQKPNPPRRASVVFILTDDQGYGDLSRTGNRMLETPHIDALAADGVTMNQFFVQPLCAPTRAEILTGRYFPFTGVSGVCEGAERLDLDETLVSELFKEAGYATGCFGKWHSGIQYPYHPCARGFDEFIGFCCGHWSHYFDSTIEHNGREYKSKGYLPDVLTSHAIDFISEHASTAATGPGQAVQAKPFFCYLPLNTPHSPWQAPDAYYQKFAEMEISQRATLPANEVDDVTRCALAMCENIDWNVGRVIARLKELGIYDNTIVVYLSDNGPNSNRWNGGLRGIKGSTCEGGVRSPCSITFPARIPAGTEIAQVASSTDFLPTLCALCGVATTTDKPIHGIDLTGVLCDGEQLPDRAVYTIAPHRRAASIRQGDYRYHHNGELYNISDDIGETSDLADDQPERAEAMRGELDTIFAEFPPIVQNAVIPVGFEAWPVTYLQTQDAKLQGTLKRSSIHPNCSWICEWQDLDDALLWQLDVETAGTYTVGVMYSAHSGQLGSRFAAECGVGHCEFQIDEEFNHPELRGFDRHPRQESYEKEFALMECGTMALPKGPAEFILKALRMPGDAMPHVRALKLELQR
jgi:arylsulfatase A-like enzyme